MAFLSCPFYLLVLYNYEGDIVHNAFYNLITAEAIVTILGPFL